MAEKAIIKLVKRYAKLLQKNGIPLDAVFLYGSHVSGQATPESDIDLLVVSSLFDKDRYARLGELWNLTRYIDTRIEPIVVGEKQFRTDDVTPIYEIVRQTGIKVI